MVDTLFFNMGTSVHMMKIFNTPTIPHTVAFKKKGQSNYRLKINQFQQLPIRILIKKNKSQQKIT